MAHRLSCSRVCGIFPDQGLNPCLLYRQTDFLPLSHQGRPDPIFKCECVVLGQPFHRVTVYRIWQVADALDAVCSAGSSRPCHTLPCPGSSDYASVVSACCVVFLLIEKLFSKASIKSCKPEGIPEGKLISRKLTKRTFSCENDFKKKCSQIKMSLC